MAMCSPLRLAWQASCCRVHAVAMVSAGAALQCSLAPSVLGVSWVENAVIPLIFSPGGGIHPAATPLSPCWHTSAQSHTHVQTHSSTVKEDCCFGVGHASSIRRQNNVREAEQICFAPAKRPRCSVQAMGVRKTNKYSGARLSPVRKEVSQIRKIETGLNFIIKILC